jgi:hypothetical protein
MTITRKIWEPVKLPVIATLTALRSAVLERSERRSPKWKLVAAADLIIELQPKPSARTLFAGHAVEAAGVDARAFWPAYARVLPTPRNTLGFEIRAAGEAWQFKPRSAGHFPPSPPARRLLDRDVHHRAMLALRERLAAVFCDVDRFGHIDAIGLLGGHCLCCGKALTDPVSMARRIGPECWGSASATIPWRLRAHKPDEDLVLQPEPREHLRPPKLPPPKPAAVLVQHCTVYGDLRTDMRTWKVEPLAPYARHQRAVEITFQEGRKRAHSRIVVTPGGRWATVESPDGAILYDSRTDIPVDMEKWEAGRREWIEGQEACAGRQGGDDAHR